MTEQFAVPGKDAVKTGWRTLFATGTEARLTMAPAGAGIIGFC